jgi:hypothetical protein
VLSPWRWRVQRLTRLCDLATFRSPPPVLRTREATRVPCASALQARGRGSTRQPWATIAAGRGAGAGVPSPAAGCGGRASGLLGVHGRRAPSRAEPSPEAHPVHVQCGVRLTRSAPSPWRNWSSSQACGRVHRSYTARPSGWASSVNAVPGPCVFSKRGRDVWPAGWARSTSTAAAEKAHGRDAWPLLAPVVP